MLSQQAGTAAVRVTVPAAAAGRVAPSIAFGPGTGVAGLVVVAGEDLALSGFGSQRGRGTGRYGRKVGCYCWGVAGPAHTFHRQGDERGGDG